MLTEIGAPDEVDGGRLETVLIKYRQKGLEFLDISFGFSKNY